MFSTYLVFAAKDEGRAGRNVELEPLFVFEVRSYGVVFDCVISKAKATKLGSIGVEYYVINTFFHKDAVVGK